MLRRPIRDPLDRVHVAHISGYAETLPAAWTLGVRPYLGGALVKSFLVATAVALGSLTPWLTWRTGKWGLGVLTPLIFWRIICSEPVQRLIAWIDETTVAVVWAWEPGGGGIIRRLCWRKRSRVAGLTRGSIVAPSFGPGPKELAMRRAPAGRRRRPRGPSRRRRSRIKHDVRAWMSRMSVSVAPTPSDA